VLLAVARCDALAERSARHRRVRGLVAEAVARDRGEAQWAAVALARPGQRPERSLAASGCFW
jgi:hypothetical protein